MKNYYAGAFAVGLSLFAAGCGDPLTAPDARADNEAAIRATDIAWSKAAAAKEVDKIVSYYTNDASSFVDHGPIATGKDAIRGQWDELFMMGFSINWQPTKVEVAKSGDLGYSQGTYEENATEGKNPSRGKYVVIWKKQGDGTWKAISEIANAD